MMTPEPHPTSSTLSPGMIASALSNPRTKAIYPERPRSSRLATLPSSGREGLWCNNPPLALGSAAPIAQAIDRAAAARAARRRRGRGRRCRRFRFLQPDRWQSAATGKESPDRLEDAIAALGGNIRPGQAGIIVKHHWGCSRQIRQSGLDAARTRPMVAGHDEQPLAKRCRGRAPPGTALSARRRARAVATARSCRFRPNRKAPGTRWHH
jgi:hypothetical protein